ncbi:arylesterase [Sphingosinicella sp. LHD-64]|nr:arylesterase [Sphingosinicella sp. LHD-64]MDQ8755123.1 arylesterase [Sphingosinicella sp. LHD-64]
MSCSTETPQNISTGDRAASTNTAAPVAEGRLVLAFGDSLYAGYQLRQNEGFAPALERALVARGVPATVVNAGVSGDTTASGLQRLAFTLDGLPRAPDLAIVGLGGNDALRGISPDETRRNLAAILTELRRRNIPVLLTGMMAPRNLGADYAARFDPIYPELARAFGTGLYPFFLDGVITRPDLLLPDGMHPTTQGIGVVVERMAPDVARRLDAQPGT